MISNHSASIRGSRWRPGQGLAVTAAQAVLGGNCSKQRRVDPPLCTNEPF